MVRMLLPNQMNQHQQQPAILYVNNSRFENIFIFLFVCVCLQVDLTLSDSDDDAPILRKSSNANTAKASFIANGRSRLQY